MKLLMILSLLISSVALATPSPLPSPSPRTPAELAADYLTVQARAAEFAATCAAIVSPTALQTAQCKLQSDAAVVQELQIQAKASPTPGP